MDKGAREALQPAPMALPDYVAVLARRKWHVIIAVVFVLGTSALFAFLLPPVFRAEAVILIEREEIPQDFVATTVTGYVQERIEAISQRILTNTVLSATAEEFDLYPDERDADTRSAIVGRMRQAIGVEMIDVNASNAGTGRSRVATVAFKVTFDYQDPTVARDVCNHLAELYLAENRREREERAAGVARFLAGEAQRLEQEILRYEQKLAQFKEQHVTHMPELASINMTLLERTEASLARTEEALTALNERRISLEGQLAVTERTRPLSGAGKDAVLSPAERLVVLRSELMEKLPAYSSSHPDIVRLTREIKALEESGVGSGNRSYVAHQLAVRQAELAAMRQTYSAEHPDVRRTQNEIESLQQRLSALPDTSAAEGEYGSGGIPENPAYVSLKTQQLAVMANIRAKQTEREQLKAKIREYEQRLFETPSVEREYLALSRDYESARTKYRELKEKQREAELAEELERSQKAEEFTVVQQAFAPGQPISPNRPGILLLGVVLAGGAGLGTAAAAELLDDTVRGSKGVARLLRTPPLAVIPRIETVADRRRRMLKVVVVSAGVVVAVAVLLWLLVYTVAEDGSESRPNVSAATSALQ